MRELNVEVITDAVREMCIEAIYGLTPDMCEQRVKRNPPWAGRFCISWKKISKLPEMTGFRSVRTPAWPLFFWKSARRSF